MKIKTSELIGKPLDHAVAVCLDKIGKRIYMIEGFYSTSWREGGPIIEKEHIRISQYRDNLSFWEADIVTDRGGKFYQGPTPLIAAMRCYVASKLGDEVDIPEELV